MGDPFGADRADLVPVRSSPAGPCAGVRCGPCNILRPPVGFSALAHPVVDEHASLAMPVLIIVLVVGASAVLVVEFLLTAAAGLFAYRPGIERFAHLTGFTPSPLVYRALGVLDLIGVAGIIAGAWRPVLAVLAASYFAVLAAFTLVRQVQRGQRGQELFAYTLFLVSALIVVAVRASSIS